MCGRFLLTTPVSEMARLFGFSNLPNLEPRYNVAPTQEVGVIRPAGSGRELVLMRWGLVPSWAEDPGIGARLINARGETLADKPAFRSAFRRRRALAPADGFYEWQGAAKGRKRPFVIRRRDRVPMAFAALWERWRDLETVTIVTTAANATLRGLHDRMPAILPEEAWEPWLNENTPPETLEALLKPAPDSLLDAVEVGPRVNSVRNDDPACLEPPGGQTSLF